MKRIVLSSIALVMLCSVPLLRAQATGTDQSMPTMPSTEEVNDLLSEASEYVETYQRIFKNAKPTLDKAPTPGFNQRTDELCSQADTIIAALQKNGPTAYSLVALIGVLDDLSLNASKAYAMAMIVGMQEANNDAGRRALQDIQDLAQAGKNIYDISELLMHSTLRLISFEEKVLHTLAATQK